MRNIMTSKGDFVSEEEAAKIMKMTKSEMDTAVLVAGAVAQAIFNSNLDKMTQFKLALLADEYASAAIRKRELVVELPIEIVMEEFGITEEQAHIVTYFVDGSTTALVFLSKMGMLPREQTFVIARDMTRRTKEAFDAAAMTKADTIGEVQGHA